VEVKDLDFVMADFVKGGPDGWETVPFKDTDPLYFLNTLRYSKGDLFVDSFSLDDFGGSMQGYCADTPLNVQGIAFNVRTGQLIGEPGIRAIQNEIVCVQSMEKAELYANFRGLTVEQLVQKKAEQLGFTADLSDVKG